jgi:hypothetical protein
VYTLKVAAPVFDPKAGVFANAVTVKATTATAGATIRYTTDGKDPTSASPVFPAAGVPLARTTTLKARGFKVGMTDSDVTSGVYTLKVAAPVFDPKAGVFANAVTVKATTTTAGATIRYTTDGKDPTSASPVFPAAGVPLARTTTLKARGFKVGMTDSDVTSGIYRIAAKIIITQSPILLATPVPILTPTFKGRVLDADGKGVSGLTVGVHDPVKQQSLPIPTATDTDGYWTYSTSSILTEGVYAFTFILDSTSGKSTACILRTTASHVPTACLERFDSVAYMPTIVRGLDTDPATSGITSMCRMVWKPTPRIRVGLRASRNGKKQRRTISGNRTGFKMVLTSLSMRPKAPCVLLVSLAPLRLERSLAARLSLSM